ncbi:MAG: hypothetical protein A3E57_08040 [Candidatus Muproteobacteria bacterium RIFCSPHIGHO2_12_FULL_60_33]|uniref:Uncharacterized protein n=1 Tax=Candidatus Muproteobacteria bacterium RIFCSPLOWO2_01_FULL_60_18 TaxID=1817768 RepID=A0A1F6U5E1_9PROT|nr:MAG: hypothetical protein A3A87_02230 [Candidatus Muproteobacteria bacterium RIFCSPLOWO2_01_FULL_60_18]OGI53076.1 MAG: hypothetical protein A2W42_02715 [Candidatus Muproteobacteria bacterium RIFCSPHIGHO2_01_60_12]OGI54310.1 MAG: hypothetical protein A3E57_08040 [Candidatus Muproteobacteria bacterium RIFCSPHIGHO2_12_FULL_60_33]OGI59315.1 MAG: hypothetical protein A2809_01340 [Candidatus Muproteobacteria bacterium RIFCSPHIGHO2_01_FULL_61_200]
MSMHSSSNNENGNGNPGLGQGKTWIACGRRLVLEQKPLWYGMTAVYFVLGFVLKLIPFMGDLLLILITPMLLAGVVWGRAQEQHAEPAAKPDSSSPALALFQTWIAQPAQELMRIFTQEDKMFAAVLLGIVTLGLAMLVKIIGYLLVGGSMLSGLAASQVGTAQITTLLGMALVALLSVLLAMGLLFSVPLTVLANRQPLAAISESFSACRENAAALLTLTVPFFLVYLVILVAFAKSHWLGYLLVVSVGFLALPVFVAAVYCSYLTLYPPNPSGFRRQS